MDSIETTTQLCGIIGNPVAHSMSPALHNRAFDLLNLDYVYLAFRVAPGNVRAALDGMRALENFRGLSVTIPHKREVIDCVDVISEVDRAIGSINTIINDNGNLYGLGSDGPGARQALLDNGINSEDQTVTILGSGGASRAIAFDLVANATPAVLKLCGIVEDELHELAHDIAAMTTIPVEAVSMNESALKQAIYASQVLINTTPVGMHPNAAQSPVPATLLHEDLDVMDIVYNPLETRLLKDAAAKGLRTVSGLEMFVNQAVIQFESWTGKTAPKTVMRDVVLAKLTSGQRS
ncbi:MAG: shikimate dehydrogenase [Deltaproteobacteria bacterium]|nr:shikimate dehydrogenase [Deltaproteobacteria bacterium]MBN2671492.1 shikimate dehydrogenase [Deltaproteobacteria bacterium]